MNRLAARLAADQPLLWVAAEDYAAKLLAGGDAPWGDVAALADWLRRTQGLLKSDVVALPLDKLCDAWLAAHPALLVAMAEKPRPAFALRTLLGDAGIQRHVAAAAAAVRAVVDAPLVLTIPEPGEWLAAEHVRAGGGAFAATPDHDDDAGVYVADLLRGLAGDIDALFVRGGAVPVPLLNVAKHFGWLAGSATGPGFAVAPLALAGVPTFVTGDAPGARARYLSIAPEAAPEAVLARLAASRA